MKRLLIVTALALIIVPNASAMYDRMPHVAERMMHRVQDYRVDNGLRYVRPSLRDRTATIALAEANYRNGNWSARIDGVPFTIWGGAFYGNDRASMLLARRCHGKPFSPRQALNAMLANDRILSRLWRPYFRKIGVSAAKIRKDKGDFKGKGTCTCYWVSMSER